jgi:hypothetical protein
MSKQRLRYRWTKKALYRSVAVSGGAAVRVRVGFGEPAELDAAMARDMAWALLKAAECVDLVPPVNVAQWWVRDAHDKKLGRR